METVFLCGKERDLLGSLLYPLLKQNGTVDVWKEGGNPNGRGVDFLLVYPETMKELLFSRGLVVFTGGEEIPEGLALGKKCIGVAENQNKTALSLLKSAGVPVLTCGMGSKNSLTFSSRKDCSAAFSLQRRITACNGQTIEPKEIPFYFPRPLSNHQLLLLCGALLFLLPDQEQFTLPE